MEKLAYSLLNDRDKILYRGLENAILNHSSGCDMPVVSRNSSIMQVLESVLSDHPEIIYFNRTLLRTNDVLFPKRVNFTGIVSLKEEKKREQKLSEELKNAVFDIDKAAKNDREIIRGISEYLQRNIKYDYKEASSMSFWRGSSMPDSHNSYGALVNKLAVCDGISSAFSLIANELGLRNMVVEGKAKRNGTRNIDHAWNIIEYQNAFYHMDVTWDLGGYEALGQYPYFYFGLADNEIAIDHEWNYKKTPRCKKNDLSYYAYNRLIAFSIDQIDAIARRELKLGKKCIRIKLADDIPVEDVDGDYISNRIMAQASDIGIAIQFNGSWNSYAKCFIAVLV